MEEPKYIAYRIDLKRFKDFYSLSECEQFFKSKKDYLRQRAKGYDGNHFTGKKVNERWLLFDTSLSNQYVQQILKSYKSPDTTWNYDGYEKKRKLKAI
jgi:hypothetical protein